MSTHYIPKDLRGETRILIIFTVKSLITTAIFGFIGAILYFILSAVQMKVLGVILFVIFAVIGYGFGTLKMPRITGWKFTKNIEGDSLDEVVVRFAKFQSSKKMYSYTKEDK